MDPHLPQYKKVYEDLRKQIVDGIFKEGDLLPSENELCSVYGVTRPTVRQALSSLVSDGFIKKHQGKGSIVHKLPKGIGILSIAGTTSALGAKNIKSKLSSTAALILGGIALSEQILTSPQFVQIMTFIKTHSLLQIALVGGIVYLLWQDGKGGE